MNRRKTLPPLQKSKQAAYRILLLQVAIVFISAIMAIFLSNMETVWSILLAGFVTILPNLYLINKAFCIIGADSPGGILKAFYIGEVGKLIMTAALLVLVIKFCTLNIIAFLIAYICVQLSMLLAPLIIKFIMTERHA